MVGAVERSSHVAQNQSNKKPKIASTQKLEIQTWPTVTHKPILRRELLNSTQFFTKPKFLTKQECEAFIRCAEARGLEHQGSRGPGKEEAFRDYEQMSDYNVELAEMLWQAGLQDVVVGRKVAVGLNLSIRFYKYDQGQRFGPHYDASVESGGGGATEFTLLVHLTGGLSGGERVVYDRRKVVTEIASMAGMALFHIHDDPSMLHESKSVPKGVKYVLLSDVVFA